MKFAKMEGIGNDFVLIHEFEQKEIEFLISQTPMLCDRRKGIGADGLILVMPSDKANFRMRIINSDGSEPEMCGNGIRCFAKYIKLMNLSKLEHLRIETLAGIKETTIEGNGNICVNMGKPILYAPDVPVALMQSRVLMHDLSIDGKTFKINAVSMGNPHAVIYADDLTDELVLGWGPKIEKHPLFPKKTNVEFIKVLSNKEIQMRVWERGCGETQACGTGACASAVSGIVNGLHDTDVTVHLPGGDLRISWDNNEMSPVYMTGGANLVYNGEITLKVKG